MEKLCSERDPLTRPEESAECRNCPIVHFMSFSASVLHAGIKLLFLYRTEWVCRETLDLCVSST